MALQHQTGLAVNAGDLIDRILDKGLVINADIKVSVVGVELLDIEIRAALASFETAAMYGLEFPSGTKLPAWAGTTLPAWARHTGATVSKNGASEAALLRQ